MDWGERKVWVLASPNEASTLLPASRSSKGRSRRPTSRLRTGGWVVLAEALASEHHLRSGASVTLPTPVPMSFRVAALSTNIGWAPGAVTMTASDYARAWGSTDASAYNVLLDRGLSSARGGRRDRASARPCLGPVRAEREGTRDRAERAQPPGPAAPNADRDADLDRSERLVWARGFAEPTPC